MRAVPCSRSGPVSKHPAGATRAAALVLFGVGLVTVLCLTQRINVVDDAYISYRYVLNLVDAHQLVFNLGERVEGATNLLWLLVLSATTVVSGLRPEVLAMACRCCSTGMPWRESPMSAGGSPAASRPGCSRPPRSS